MQAEDKILAAKVFSKFPVIELDDEFVLRDFKPTDAEAYYQLYSIPEINRFIPDAMIPRSIEEAQFEIAAILQNFRYKNTVYWAIVDKKTDTMIGGCGFHDWHRFNKRIEVAYDLHPQYHGKGIMKKSLAKITDFAFKNMFVNRVQATTLPENEASNKLLLSCGFEYEGLLKKYKIFKGSVVDVMMFSCVK